ncbi:hypothetical protein [Paenirhodobacter populi]|uniref:TOBE domain-containing protein n=1 Tax=Paenirhodobacter populi TaxID=2306993 RepID=A0A443JKR7_9RHOB|nr:hypothetical protein [Sinirhodobacter populi]RWR21083.1 hypothetical protein D2T30_09545 [Sinirhodobacter populi]RWR32457.1 hypothetical protein D2T31_00260 [Sinirhodobacter populi]
MRLISHELVGGQVIVRLATPGGDLSAVIDREDGGGFAVADRVSLPAHKLHFFGADGRSVSP